MNDTNFPSIEQYRHAIENLIRLDIPSQRYVGTIKVHGTNARITVREDGTRTYGSRNQSGLTGGHYGFVEWAREQKIFALGPKIPYTIYGEWAGKGIQAGIEYPKTFFPFAVLQHEGEKWFGSECLLTSYGAYRLNDHENDNARAEWIPVCVFGRFSVELNQTDNEFTEKYLEELVSEIDEKCPVASMLGHGGHGEGIVFIPWLSLNPAHGFKVKGESHRTTGVKIGKSAPIEGLEEFLATVCTEARMNQGLEWIPLEIEYTGHFVKWILSDVIKEDSDLIPAEADPKRYTSPVGRRAANWFKEKIRNVPIVYPNSGY